MMHRSLLALVTTCSLALSAVTGCAASTNNDPTQSQNDAIDANNKTKCEIKSETLMIQSELIFGSLRQNLPPVTDAQWQNFVDTDITPKFPDGFSVIAVQGQWKASDGTIEKEPSHMLLVYNDGSKATSDKLEQLRNDYKQQFQQESVLRTDTQICVAF